MDGNNDSIASRHTPEGPAIRYTLPIMHFKGDNQRRGTTSRLYVLIELLDRQKHRTLDSIAGHMATDPCTVSNVRESRLQFWGLVPQGSRPPPAPGLDSTHTE
jgi:hypothetical protein